MSEHPRPHDSRPKNTTSFWRPRITTMSDVQETPIRWLWPGRIALGRLSLLCGIPGTGKSYLTAAMSAIVTKGTSWPDGAQCDRGSVLMLTAEDDPGDTIKPRLRVHGADDSRVHVLSGMYEPDRDDPYLDPMVSLSDTSVIEDAIREIGDVRLLVVDPIGSFIGARLDAHRDNEVRASLAPVAAIAADHDVAVLLVAHRRKSSGVAADDLVMGSRAFTGICRSVWHLSADPSDPDRRLFLPGKSNLAKQADGLAFRIEGDPVGVIAWEPEPVHMTADEALAKEREGGTSPKSDDAQDWLKDWLASGPKPAVETKEAAQRDGFKERTLDRAAEKLDVVKGPGGFGGAWIWRLPDEEETQCAPSIPQSRQGNECGETADTDETVARL